MSEYKVDDRVELVSMKDDPDPITPGTKGTVTRVMNLIFRSQTDQKFSYTLNGTTAAACPVFARQT